MQLYHCRAWPSKVLHQSVDHLKHVVLLTPSFAQMSELTQGKFIEAISICYATELAPPPTQLDLPVSTPSRLRTENSVPLCNSLVLAQHHFSLSTTLWEEDLNCMKIFPCKPYRLSDSVKHCTAMHAVVNASPRL